MIIAKMNFRLLLLSIYTILTGVLSNAQICTAKILQKDTTICSGNALQLTVSINDSSDNCNTYSLSSSLQNGLLGWFPFCGNTDDIGPQHNNAVAYGPLSYGTDRYNKPNTAIYFKGNGESVHTNKIERTTINSFSYVTWVNTSNSVVLPSETINPYSGFSIDLSSTCVIHATHGYNWAIDHNNTGAGLFVATNGVFVLEHTDVIIPTPLVWQGNLVGWHSVALVYDNHVPNLYIDGKFVKSGLVTPYIVHPSFGCDSFYTAGRYAYITCGFGKGFNPSGATVPSNNFRGAIDDIKIYNRALSANEIAELYARDKSRILWSTGDTTKTITVSPVSDSVYHVTVTNDLGACTDSVKIYVLQVKSVNTNTTICNGDVYILPSGKPVSSAGVYIDTLYSMGGCDSLITTLTLSVYSAPVHQNLSAAICTGQTYTLPSGRIVSSTGIYTDTLKNKTGCDSLITTLTLSVYSAPVQQNITSSLCAAQTYILPSGRIVSSTGIYTDTLKNKAGCDSLITTLTLSVYSAPVQQSLTAAICTGQTYTLPSGRIVSSTGIYTDTLKNKAGCDSLITTLTLSVYSAPVQQSLTAAICTGQTYTLPSGRIVSSAGIYPDTIKNNAGCDSLVSSVNLSYHNVVLNNLQVSICPSQFYTLPSGTIVNASGIYSDTLRYAAGCDSVITILQLHVSSPPVTNNVSVSLCQGENYILPSGRIVTTTGFIIDTLRTSAGCDSIITIAGIYVTPKTIYSHDISICDGDSFTLPWGVSVNKTGIYNDTIRTMQGCDSIINSFSITVHNKPVIKTSKSNDIYCSAGISNLSASGGVQYQWSPVASLNNPSIASPVAAPTATTVYHVTVENEFGCIAEDSIEVIVNTIGSNQAYQLPNAFTPNNDGKNDCFGIRNWGAVTNLNFLIFDRWGNNVFHTTNYSECWDGTANGNTCVGGIYVYYLTAHSGCGEIVRKGTVLLIR
ncbi:MAG: gliding motility-associated C-terminal domain-containing protein [Bacteroidetes bacterium]|nr:gliding motility-associated C-terminal domain-containing protein [Bacteroidota bacterium]MBS1930557.1 gliding motility-associated C-terminal domain-containing protein [Bacteroidota bacterium]